MLLTVRENLLKKIKMVVKMKKILFILAGLLVVVGIAVFVLVGNLDKVVKSAMEGVGSELMGVPVTVSSVGIKLKNGEGEIAGLVIGNPAGFTSSNAFQMDVIRLGIDLGSIGKQPIVINELRIDKPIVNLELKDDGSSNLQTITDSMEKNGSKADKKAAEEQSEAEGTPKGEPVKIAFKKLNITGVTVNVIKEGLATQNETIVIPDIVLTNVGGVEGITPAELGNVVFGEITNSALKNALQKQFTKQVEEATKGLFDNLKKQINVE